MFNTYEQSGLHQWAMLEPVQETENGYNMALFYNTCFGKSYSGRLISDLFPVVIDRAKPITKGIKMKYMLVVQFSQNSIDLDEILYIEDSLQVSLKNIAELDHHYIGSEEINFFLTDTPIEIFKKIKMTIENKLYVDFSAAYREVDGEQYRLLWPKSLKVFRIK